jgi:hypothetical protein
VTCSSVSGQMTLAARRHNYSHGGYFYSREGGLDYTVGLSPDYHKSSGTEFVAPEKAW